MSKLVSNSFETQSDSWTDPGEDIGGGMPKLPTQGFEVAHGSATLEMDEEDVDLGTYERAKPFLEDDARNALESEIGGGWDMSWEMKLPEGKDLNSPITSGDVVTMISADAQREEDLGVGESVDNIVDYLLEVKGEFPTYLHPPYQGSDAWEHEKMRINSMSERGLRARVYKCSPAKLIAFANVLQAVGYTSIAKEAFEELKNLGYVPDGTRLQGGDWTLKAKAKPAPAPAKKPVKKGKPEGPVRVKAGEKEFDLDPLTGRILADLRKESSEKYGSNSEDEPEYDDDYAFTNNCDQCGGHLEKMGTLGNRRWFRCRNCGWEVSTDLKTGVREAVRPADAKMDKDEGYHCDSCGPTIPEWVDGQPYCSSCGKRVYHLGDKIDAAELRMTDR